MRFGINFLVITTLLTFQFGCAQKDSLDFKISTNYLDGKSYLTKTKTVENPNSVIDIYFFKEHFAQFYGLPKDLVKENFKNQEITKWRFEDKSKEFYENWTDTFKYDSNGRLIEYIYSGCTICSQFPYGYKLIYNQDNDIIEQQFYPLILKVNSENHATKTQVALKNQMTYKIKLTYDNHRNIIKVEKLGKSGLIELIEWIK